MSEHIWTPNSTQLMLQLYAERIDQFRDKSILKKSLRQDMANIMLENGFTGVTENLIDRKMRNMRKTYRIVNDKKSYGHQLVRWQYYEIMDKLFSEDDSVDLLSQISSLKTVDVVQSEYMETPQQTLVDCADENSTDVKEHSWTPNSTALMIELYAARIDGFRDPRMLKKCLWQEISQELENAGYANISVEALDRKMRNLKKTYRTITEKNKRSGKPECKTKWTHYEAFKTLFPFDKTMSEELSTSTVQPEPIEEITLCGFLDESAESSSSGTLVEASSEINEQCWTPKCTKLLMQLYVERKNKFRDPRIEKKYLWREMRKQMEDAGYENLSDDALELKIRSLKKTYRTIKKDDKKSGKRAGWPYYEIFNEILSDDKTNDITSTIKSLKTEQNDQDISFDFIDELSESSYDCLENASTSPSIKVDEDDSMPNASISLLEDPQAKKTYTQQEELIKVEKERVKAIDRLTKKIDECNRIQTERNELLKEFLNKFA